MLKVNTNYRAKEKKIHEKTQLINDKSGMKPENNRPLLFRFLLLAYYCNKQNTFTYSHVPKILIIKSFYFRGLTIKIVH
jgi:hypothetical protein